MTKKTSRVIAALTLVLGLSIASLPASAAPVVLGDAPAIATWFGGSAFWTFVRDVFGDVLGKTGTIIDESGNPQNGSGTGD